VKRSVANDTAACAGGGCQIFNSASILRLLFRLTRAARLHHLQLIEAPVSQSANPPKPALD
jgi:hypothetical protein